MCIRDSFNSAVTPAVGSIRKCSTRLRTLWCTPCSVAKRRQFSCPLRAWTLPLKFENVIPQGGICTTVVGQVIYTKYFVFFFFLSSYEYFSRASTHIFSIKINDVCDHISFIFFGILLKLIAASVTSIPKCSSLEYLPCLYTSPQAEP